MKLLVMFLQRSPRRLCCATIAGILSGLSTTALIVAVNQMIQLRGRCSSAVVSTFAMLCIVRLLCGITSHALLVRLSQDALHDLRIDLCQKIMRAPLRQLEKLGPSRLATVFGDDMLLIASAAINLPYVFVNLIILGGCLAYLGWLSWQMLLGIGACAAVGALTYAIVTTRANVRLRMARQEHDHLFRHFRNLITGIKELKLNAARRDEMMQAQLGAAADRVKRHNTLGITIYSAAANWSRMLFFVYVGLLLLWPANGRSPTELAACVLVILYMMAPLEAILNALPAVAQAGVSLGKVELLRSALDSENAAFETLDSRTSAVQWRELALIDVCHRYEDVTGGCCHPFSLGPISLTLRPGEITFLVGGNGSGKTTLGKLITGLYRLDSGDVRLDGEALSTLGQQQTRAMFAAVFNDFCLFDEFLGIDPSRMQTAERYLKLLQLDHKVAIIDRRFSTMDLSQGQRKRLALLVALLEDRPIYLFDEWAADQDPEFKELFYRQVVPELSRRAKAVVVITHDDRYFDLADRLIRLENGCAVEAPTLLDQRSRWQFATRALCLILFTAVGVAAADVARAATTAVPDVSAIDDGSTKANELFSGIECLQNAGTLLGRSPDMIDLLRAAKSSSEGGSTAKQLASIGTAQHLNAIVLDHISADQIARCPYPIMLHVKGGRYSSQPDYYVLCTGTRGGRVNLFDPPSRQSVITLSQLEEDRRAEAIILSGERLPPAAGYLHRSVPLATYGLMIAATAGMGVLAVACRRRPRGSTGRSGLRHVWASSLQLLGISIASLLLSFVCQSASGRALLPASDGLATEPIDFIMPGTAPGAHSIVDPPEISVAVALQMINRNALFVDARDPAEYNAGHIRGAVLCPATDVGRWHVHLAGIDLHRRIIVYCAEASCHKGEYVATFLLSCGFSDVSLYRAGWAQWTGPKEAQ